MKKTKIITTVVMIIVFLFFIINPVVKATIDPDKYDPNKHGLSASDVQIVTGMANPVIGIIKTLGIIVAVVTIGILGIKYMTGSVDEKAEYKKTMIPYLIGVFLVVSITQIIALVIKLIPN